MLRTYSVVSLVASIFTAQSLAMATPVQTQEARAGRVSVQGFVLATDSCQLVPVGSATGCSSRVIPIEGKIALYKRSTAHRVLLNLNSSGVFTRRLEPGPYRVKLVRPHAQGITLKRSAFRIYPPRLRIQPNSRQSAQGRTQANVFVVSHKSHGAPPSIGISH